MSSGKCDFLRTMGMPNDHKNVRSCKQGEDLGSIYSFKKPAKTRTRKITPVSQKFSLLPKCRQQEPKTCWALEEESEEAETEEENEEKVPEVAEIQFTFDEDYSVERPDNKRSDSATADLGLCPRSFGNHPEGRPASFSDYTEIALQMRIKHEMERFLTVGIPSRRRAGSEDVSPLLKRAVFSNTLTGRKTTVDSGYHEDLMSEEKVLESDEDSISCDPMSSDDEHPGPMRSNPVNGYCLYDKGSMRRRKVTPVPRSKGPLRKEITRSRGNRREKSCISLEEEDFEDVENFNSDDDFVDMGISTKQASKPISKAEDCITRSLSPSSDDGHESRLRSYSSGCHGDSSDNSETHRRTEPRRRKRAVTLIPALGELEKCRDVRNNEGNPTPLSCSSGTQSSRSIPSVVNDESSSVLVPPAASTVGKDQNPSIQVEVEDGESTEATNGRSQIENDMNAENELKSLGEYLPNPKAVTRRKLTPADIGHPSLGKMKELRQQMVGLHLEEGDEGTEHKGHSTPDP